MKYKISSFPTGNILRIYPLEYFNFVEETRRLVENNTRLCKGNAGELEILK